MSCDAPRHTGIAYACGSMKAALQVLATEFLQREARLAVTES
jgi:hypothetical protein